MGVSIIDSVKKRAVFLDRDGVLNQSIIKYGKPYPPNTPDEVIIPNDVKGALIALHENNFLLIGVTNQPDVARGTQTFEQVHRINQLLLSMLPLTEIRTCFHDDSDKCDCRKPKPGLILQAAKTHHIDLSNSIMIGDRWRDIEAGRSAGSGYIIWLDQQYKEKMPINHDYRATSLSDAADWISKTILL